MTSPMTQSKPFLPPKPTKYRAPAPPRPQPPSCAARPPSCPRQPPPGDDPPPPAEQSAPHKNRAPPCPPADVAPVAIVTSTPLRSMMRREPMQVIPSSNVRWNDGQKNDSGDGKGERGKTGGAGGSGGLREKPPSPTLTPVTVNNNNKPPTTTPTRCHDNDDGKPPVTPPPCDDVMVTKPVISDVKLLPRGSDARSSILFKSHQRHQNHYQQSPLVSDQQQQQLRSCRSTESLDRLNLLADLSGGAGGGQSLSQTPVGGGGGGGGGGSSCRSSFVDPNCPTSGSARRSVYIDLGDYQTLLKHGQQDAVYSLPQPQCYGDDTLRAVRLITEKYDTFKRRQLRALSFRDAVVRGPGRQQSVEGEGASAVIAEGVELDASTVTSDNRPPVPAADVGVTSSDDTSAAAENEQQQQQHQQRPADVTTASLAITLSRTIMTLSRYGLESGFSSSSVHDVSLLSSPPEGPEAVLSLPAETSNDEERGMTRTDRLRIEMFYRSRETEVYVCSSLADLFLGACGASETDSDRWIHLHTGVPVWLLNTGRAIRRRELVILLADRQTGLPLWRDRISYLSNYGPVDDSGVDVGRIHSLRLSSSLSKAVRLSMFCCRSAAAFLARYRQFTADPSDDLWKISDGAASQPTTKTRRRRRRGRNGSLAIRKASISVPCSVVLVTRVDPRHPNFRAAFAHLLPPPTAHCSTSSSSPPPDVAPSLPATVDPVAENCGVVGGEMCEFRPRLPTR